MFDNINIFYNDAEIHITEFRARKVIRILKKRIAEGEKSAQNYAFLADAYIVDKKWHKALKCALRAKSIDADYYYTNVLLIQIYSYDGRYAKAEKYLAELLEKAPEGYYLAYFCACMFYGQTYRMKASKNYANKLFELNFKTPDYFVMKSWCYLGLGEAGNAFKSILKAMSKDCKNICLATQIFLLSSSVFCWITDKLKMDIYILDGLNLILARLFRFISKDEYYYGLSKNYYEKPDKCLANIEKSINIDPKPLYLIRKAFILGMLDKTDEEIEIYKTILKKDSSYAECYGYLCGCYQIKRDYKSALEYANLALLNNSSDESAYYHKINILRKLNRASEALKVLDKLEKVCPDSQNLYYYYANIYADLEDYNKALLYINKQLIKEKDAQNYREKMYYLYRLERYDEALKAGKNALEYDEQGIIYYWLACSLERLSKYDEALEYINLAISLGEYDKWTFWQKANILGALGRETEANFAYKKAIELGYKEE